jgi:phosphomannomutase
MGAFLACFKAYDVRGKVPSELNSDVAYAIGRALADETGARTVCVGRDIRLSGPELSRALTQGLNHAGVDVVDLGLVGTEMVYFATARYGYDGGVMITASHNPPEYNGMKIVREESRPISGDTGLYAIEERAANGKFTRTGEGSVREQDVYEDFTEHLLTFADAATMRPLRVLANAGNGAAGIAMDRLMTHLPLQVERMRFEPDGHFPHGVPNPILEESRADMEAQMRAAAAAGTPFDFGVAWDGDYDRCFFLTGSGEFIEGYYIVGVLAQALLHTTPGATIIYDPRLTWNTLEIVAQMGGRAVMCKSGHAFIKERMRIEDAVYGGEMSAHHYFKGHWYCDSGMIPLMLIADLLSKTGKSMDDLVGEMMRRYPCSGEINSTVESVEKTLKNVESFYSGGLIDRTDGLSIEFPEWRFNLRGSNTEPVIRLNVEARGSNDLMREKTEEVLNLVRGKK